MMQMSGSEIRQALRDFELRELFNGLGWDYSDERQYVTVTDDEGADSWYELNAVAQKRGMMVFAVVARPGESLPNAAARKKIERELTKLYTEHFVVFASADKGEQVWQWVKRQSGSPAMVREQRFTGGNPTENLVQRIRGISFSIEEEEGLGELDVFGRVQASFDVERLTKRFYESFKKEHDAFLGFIHGLDDIEEKRWYASIMLNRLMFVYFVQRKGFLDNNQNYMRDKMRQMQTEEVEGNFLTFYKRFLLKLFLEGLGRTRSSREPEVDRLIGDIPYLNGGLFDVHGIEESNPNLDIPDEAFERVFDFFDRYDWHLDERPLKNNNEINPDVLGYIFEKYINQKQMGAYYTQEDVTGYITQNTVIPYLFDATEEECHIAFRPDSAMWGLLADNPDLYIYDAVLKGVDEPLPREVAAGIEDVSERGLWNRAADAEYALPTETWREHVARRQRCEGLRAKMAGGEVKSIDELVTLNLNIRQFAEDAVTHCEGADFLRAFYKAVREVSVLDPTCGSGAFLFAALNVLEPLYDACLERMRQFVEEDTTGERYQDFRENLAEVADHTSRRYFILKSIVVNNLYGVDIMEEAVEIARLRLFLKLMAQIETRDEIEPLPDLDFNLRAGNTLVGFSGMEQVRRTLEKKLDFGGSAEQIKEGAKAADDAFQQFRGMQTEDSEKTTSEDLAEAKAKLRERLGDLNAKLDRYLAAEYGVDPKYSEALAEWQVSHHPFHWLVEFYGIMQGGGFDVIIGNPPYVEYRLVRNTYKVLPMQYQSESVGNLYAFCMERSTTLGNQAGRYGMIVPAGLMGLGDAEPLRTALLQSYSMSDCSTYAIRPSKLFDGVDQRLCIYLAKAGSANRDFSLRTTRYHHWNSEERPSLLARLKYVDSFYHPKLNRIPQVGEAQSVAVLRKLDENKQTIHNYYTSRRTGHVMHYHRSPRYWIRAMDFDPHFKSPTRSRSVHHFRDLYFADPVMAKVAGAALNSSLFFFWFVSLGNGRNITGTDVEQFPLGTPSEAVLEALPAVFDRLMADYRKNSVIRVRQDSEFQEFRPSLSKPIIDEIDQILAEHYGFTDEELDFIINYDIKYRMGVEEG